MEFMRETLGDSLHRNTAEKNNKHRITANLIFLEVFSCISDRLKLNLNITWKTIQDWKNVQAAIVWVLLLKNIQNNANFKDVGLNTETESGDWITYEIHFALIKVSHIPRLFSVLVSQSFTFRVWERFLRLLLHFNLNLILTCNTYALLTKHYM